MPFALFEVQWDATDVWVARARIARITDGADGPPQYAEEREYDCDAAFGLATTATVVVCVRGKKPKFGPRVIGITHAEGRVRSITLADNGFGTKIRDVPTY